MYILIFQYNLSKYILSAKTQFERSLTLKAKDNFKLSASLDCFLLLSKSGVHSFIIFCGLNLNMKQWNFKFNVLLNLKQCSVYWPSLLTELCKGVCRVLLPTLLLWRNKDVLLPILALFDLRLIIKSNITT